MAFPGDPYPAQAPATDPIRDPAYANAPPAPYAPRGPDVTREVTAGPFRFSLREAVLGTLGLFAILGLVLGVLAFAAAFALDNAVDANSNAANAENAAAALPAFLVSVLPFMAAPVLALGLGSWVGHSSRRAGLGAIGGAIGCFLGPILMLLIMGIGFALGAGAANLDLSNVRAPGDVGVAPGWASTIPYLFTGAGILWLLATTLAGALSGALVGGLLEHRWTQRHDARQPRAARRGMRY